MYQGPNNDLLMPILKLAVEAQPRSIKFLVTPKVTFGRGQHIFFREVSPQVGNISFIFFGSLNISEISKKIIAIDK